MISRSHGQAWLAAPGNGSIRRPNDLLCSAAQPTVAWHREKHEAQFQGAASNLNCWKRVDRHAACSAQLEQHGLEPPRAEGVGLAAEERVSAQLASRARSL